MTRDAGAAADVRFDHGLVVGKFYPPHQATSSSYVTPWRAAGP